MGDYTTSFFAGVPESVVVELLKDRTTGRNILWSADGGDEITLNDVETIRPRVYKRLEEQKARTKRRAEVFTPVKVVKQMNDFLCDEAKDELLYSTTCEITCGEAPYIVSRYDTTTGELIPISRRIGILDRKLRVVTENTRSDEEWLEWVFRAFQSVYGYEFQGDNLLIARINLLVTFADYMQDRLNRMPTEAELQNITDIIVWNLWQMDGITGTIPFRKPKVEKQLSLFDFEVGINDNEPEQVDCKIFDWINNKILTYKEIKR